MNVELVGVIWSCAKSAWELEPAKEGVVRVKCVCEGGADAESCWESRNELDGRIHLRQKRLQTILKALSRPRNSGYHRTASEGGQPEEVGGWRRESP